MNNQSIASSESLQVGGAEPPATIRVWDPLVRLFHWSLVSSYLIAWLTADEWDQAHELAGYVVLGLLGFRIIWGLVGTRHARFSDFVRPPRVVLGYLRDMMRGRARRYIGHNPAGGAMIVALILAVGATSITGWMMTLDRFWGYEWVEELHEAAANLSLLLVGGHILGVVVSSWAHGENLVKAMITGRKRP